jgi:2-keto-4-pentenoate hydratase
VFVMRRRLVGPGVTVHDVVRATEVIMPSLEMAIGRRRRSWESRAGGAGGMSR